MGFFWGGGFEIMFGLMVLLFIGMFASILVKSLLTWNKNNRSPRLSVDAAVVTKRIKVMGDEAIGPSTLYYVTFQVESGDRLELRVDGKEYGMLVEGDRGRLSFQGTRYLGFKQF